MVCRSVRDRILRRLSDNESGHPGKSGGSFMGSLFSFRESSVSVSLAESDTASKNSEIQYSVFISLIYCR